MIYDEVSVAAEGVTVDLLVWRLHRRPMPGLVEATLDANPGLAAHGPLLPVGTRVRIPRPTASPQDAVVVRIWD